MQAPDEESCADQRYQFYDEGYFTFAEYAVRYLSHRPIRPHQGHNPRRKRIARGSGTTVQEVNNLLRQYAQMKKMFKQMGKASFARKLAGMRLPR